MEYKPDLTSEYVTGDQAFSYRKRRGKKRSPSWNEVENWRKRWTPEKVSSVLSSLEKGSSPKEISNVTGFGTIEIMDEHGQKRSVPDLRGLDLALLPPDCRRINTNGGDVTDLELNMAFFHLEGARLTDLDLSGANLTRANLQKATLRRTKFKGANLTKAHLEDADLRDSVLDGCLLGHIRYTEDSFWWRGTVLMETHLNTAQYVDPVLERCARDQYYLYVLKYRNRYNKLFRIFFFLWWVTCNYGRSAWMWAGWSIGLVLAFAQLYYMLGKESFQNPHLGWNMQTTIYYSVVTFTTLGFGDIAPKTQGAAWCVTGEVILGYIMLGGLISILATKIAQRS